MTARTLTKHLHGKWCGYYGMIACPAHADINPSCKVTDDSRKNDGIDVHCFAGCSWQDVKAALRRDGLLDEFKQSRLINFGRRKQGVVITSPAEPEPDAEAVAIWRAAAAIEGTLAERYLKAHRGLAGPFPCSLRFAASVPYRPAGLALPASCIIAASKAPARAGIQA